MKEKDIQAIGARLKQSQEDLGYAYLYPHNGSERQEFVFEMRPENIAHFLGAHQFDAEKMILMDLFDRLILDTIDGFMMNCPDQKLCRQIIPILVPIQMGGAEAKEIQTVAREQYEDYGRYEDQAAAMMSTAWNYDGGWYEN